jgi:hypothetical protein
MARTRMILNGLAEQLNPLDAALTENRERVAIEPQTQGRLNISARRKGSGLRDTQERPQLLCCQSFTS